MQLAIITLAGAAAIEAIWFNNPYWGGGQSTAPVSPPQLFGIPLGPTDSFWIGDGAVPTPGLRAVRPRRHRGLRGRSRYRAAQPAGRQDARGARQRVGDGRGRAST